MSKREIAAAAAKKYVLSLNNATANPPADRYHSVITLITLGKAEDGENINREVFLQAILTKFFIEHPVLVVPEAITDPQLTDRAFLYTCNRHFPLKYLHQVGRSLASANLLVSPAYGQELYVGVDDGAYSGSADTGVPADRCRRGSGIQRRRC